MIYGSAIGLVFGAIHLSGWDLEFPSVADKWLWRSSSLATTILPVVFIVWYATGIPEGSTKWMDALPKPLRLLFQLCWAWIFIIGIICYVAGRGILLVEMIRTLFYLPPRTYLTPSWSVDIPHIS